MNNIIKRKWNQNSMVIIEDLQGMAFQAESGGHTFQISGIDGEGNTVALSGTPAGVMLRADGQDVTLTCSVSGGVVSATLPANAYSVPGRFGLTIFLTSDGQKTAIYAAVGTVGKTSSGTVAPPAGSDVVDLVNAIAEAVATIPASYTDLMASVAPTYSSSGLYAVGSYAWYNGKLYRCTTAITSGETWTSGHWTLANLGSDLVDLKSAVKQLAQLQGDNLVALADFSSASTGITYSVDSETGEITVTNSNTANYACLQTPATFVQEHLTIGKTYRLHAKGEIVNGSPVMMVAVRGTNGNTNGDAAIFTIQNGSDAFVDFTVDQYMNKIAFYMSHGSSTKDSVAKFSEIWLKESNQSVIESVTENNTALLESMGMAAYFSKPTSPTQTVAEGNYNFKNGSISSGSSLRYATVNVSSLVGKIVSVSGKSNAVSSTNNYALYGFYDSSSNLIETFGAAATAYENKTIVIPQNAVTMIINGTATNYPVMLTENESVTSLLDGKLFKAYDYAIADEIDESSHLFDNGSEPTYENCGLMDFKTGAEYGSTNGKKYTVTPGSIYFISGATRTISSSHNYNVFGFYSQSMELISVYDTTESNTEYKDIIAVAPEGSYYCFVNGKSGSPSLLQNADKKNIRDYIISHTSANFWNGKRIGVLGTSTAFGALAETSYSYESSKLLGFNLSMFAVPGLAIHTDQNGQPLNDVKKSFTLTKAEYLSAGITIADNPITPYVPGGSYNNYYCTYENVFVEANEDIDLWIYAVIPNNNNWSLDDWNAFNKTEWKYNDDSAFSAHRKTFIGALLFIMDQMYTLNPNARMVFVIDSSIGYSSSSIGNLQALSQEWNIPIIDLWGKINTSPKSLVKLRSENGTNAHPSTFAQQIMGKMITGDLMSIS